jgi:hypothetical protein
MYLRQPEKSREITERVFRPAQMLIMAGSGAPSKNSGRAHPQLYAHSQAKGLGEMRT